MQAVSDGRLYLLLLRQSACIRCCTSRVIWWSRAVSRVSSTRAAVACRHTHTRGMSIRKHMKSLRLLSPQVLLLSTNLQSEKTPKDVYLIQKNDCQADDFMVSYKSRRDRITDFEQSVFLFFKRRKVVRQHLKSFRTHRRE